MITVNFYTTLRLYLKLGELHIDSIREISIRKLLSNIEEQVVEKTSKYFLFKLLDEKGTLKQGTIILINGKNILDSDGGGLDAGVKDGDTIALFPPGGGG